MYNNEHPNPFEQTNSSNVRAAGLDLGAAIEGSSSSEIYASAPRVFLKNFSIEGQTASNHIKGYDGNASHDTMSQMAFVVAELSLPTSPTSTGKEVYLRGYVSKADGKAFQQKITESSKTAAEGVVVEFGEFNEKQITLKDNKNENPDFVQAIKVDGSVKVTCNKAYLTITEQAESYEIGIHGTYVTGSEITVHTQVTAKQALIASKIEA